MRCPQCGNDNQQGAAFCSRCGTRLFAPKPSAVREYALATYRPSLCHDTVGTRVINFVGIELFEPFRDLAQRRVRPLAKFVVVHKRIVSTVEDNFVQPRDHENRTVVRRPHHCPSNDRSRRKFLHES